MRMEVTHAATWSQRKTGVMRRWWPRPRTGVAKTGPQWRNLSGTGSSGDGVTFTALVIINPLL
ncbi:activating signal cointegrator 1 complex subunit 1 isoform X2 [Sesbania bispinosa]|nr:activating signal cointegrator 1 complex subunit 1 isoform X2 [Sesbania bispinosa]